VSVSIMSNILVVALIQIVKLVMKMSFAMSVLGGMKASTTLVLKLMGAKSVNLLDCL